MQYSQATGAFTKNIAQSGGNPAGVIVDPSNNVYLGFGQAAVTGQGIFEYVYANNYKQPTYTVVPKPTTGIYQFAFDSSMNLWASGFNNAGVGTTTAYVLPNTGTASAPAYFGTARCAHRISGLLLLWHSVGCNRNERVHHEQQRCVQAHSQRKRKLAYRERGHGHPVD